AAEASKALVQAQAHVAELQIQKDIPRSITPQGLDQAIANARAAHLRVQQGVLTDAAARLDEAARRLVGAKGVAAVEGRRALMTTRDGLGAVINSFNSQLEELRLAAPSLVRDIPAVSLSQAWSKSALSKASSVALLQDSLIILQRAEIVASQ